MNVAYFCMEFALRSGIPNYAGGLGVLATDLMRSAADLGKPVVGVTLMYHLSEDPKAAFHPGSEFKKRPETVHLQIEDRRVEVGVWEYQVKGRQGSVTLLFLDTNLPGNRRWDRDITKNLYAGDDYTRLCQEAVLGIGGIRMLRELGYQNLQTYHMNEGHAAFLTLELLKENDYRDDAVRELCVFTTHTPIDAGHDRFPYALAERVLGGKLPWHIKELAGDRELNMTKLALSLSRKTNAVSKNHALVCGQMFPDHEFEAITNGIHLESWVSEPFAKLYDDHLAGWREDPGRLKGAENLDGEALRAAHKQTKKALIDFINSENRHFPFADDQMADDDFFKPEVLTIAFARRFVHYKRPLLIFRDLEKLRDLGDHRIQLVFAAPHVAANPFAAETVSQLTRLGKTLRGQVRVAVLPNYNVDIARLLTQGADIWLNNPQPPLEASGTSGMKAAVNGNLNLSILDGWWLEGYELLPRSGWAFGEASATQSPLNRDDIDAKGLYEALKDALNCHDHHDHWCQRMKQAIALGATFNTHRCITEYEQTLWNI